MDKRGREANHRKRSRDIKYKRISLTLDKNLIDFLYKEINNFEDKNMSQFIEENLKDYSLIKTPKRRKFGTFPIKKTFTFSVGFVKEIKKSGNMSLFVEEKLIEKFNLK